jgi:hypothetical protein
MGRAFLGVPRSHRGRRWRIDRVSVFDRVTGRRSADVEPWKLLAEKDDLPKVSFIRVAKDVTVGREPWWGAEIAADGGWGARQGRYPLRQTVIRFSGEASAARELQMAPYGRVYNDEDHLATVRPVDLGAEGPKADAASLGCMPWREERRPSCFGWAFYGRYGKYVVEVTFSSHRDPDSNRGLERDVFLEMVKGADRRIAEFNIN